MELTYRAAVREDSGAIAAAIAEASDGLVDFLLRDLVPDRSATELLQAEVERPNSIDSHCNTDVIACDGQIIAIAVSLPASQQKLTAEMEAFLPEDRLNAMREYYQSRVEESWLLDTLWVDSTFRGRGLGSQLIAQTKAKATAKGFPSLSLAVWADNDRALRLYKRHGFQTVKQIAIAPHPHLPHSTGFLLLNCPL